MKVLVQYHNLEETVVGFFSNADLALKALCEKVRAQNEGMHEIKRDDTVVDGDLLYSDLYFITDKINKYTRQRNVYHFSLLPMEENKISIDTL